jgi:hypothetical protein
MSRPPVALLVAVAVARPALAADTSMPQIVHEPCSEFERGKAFSIMARFEDESSLFEPKVIYRAKAGARWKSVALEKVSGSETFQATISVADLRGSLDYFIEVFDEYGNGPARMGDPETPIRLVGTRRPDPCVQVPAPLDPVMTTAGSDAAAGIPAGPVTATSGGLPPPAPGTCDRDDRPLYCEPWLWGAVGAVALAGAGAAAYFLFLDNDEDPSMATSVTLIVDGPDPTTTPLAGSR